MKLFSKPTPHVQPYHLSARQNSQNIHFAPYFGQDSFAPSKTPLKEELDTLISDVDAGKMTALNALEAISTRYPNLSYHGTPVLGITALEPRLALWRSAKDEPVLDGLPAVSSTADFRASLFNALIKRRTGHAAYYIDNRNGALTFKIYTPAEDWTKFKQNKDQTGIVHILNPDGMTVYRQIPLEPSYDQLKTDQKLLEFRSGEPVAPLASIKVTLQDFLEMARTDKTIRVIDGKNRPLDLN